MYLISMGVAKHTGYYLVIIYMRNMLRLVFADQSLITVFDRELTIVSNNISIRIA